MADADPVVKYQLDSSAYPGVPFRVRHVRQVEALSEPYVLQVGMVLFDADTDVEPFLGSDCVLTMDRTGTQRRVCGVVRRLSHDVPNIELTIVPAFSLLEHRIDSRIFQEKSAPEILEEVLTAALGDYGRVLELELEGDYPTREYCVQYRESDLDFAHRLMEEEGIHYTFEHDGEQEVLVLRDRNQSYPELPSGARVPYEPDNLEIVGAEPVHQFTRHHRTTPTTAVVRDWDWTKGGDLIVEAEERGSGSDGRDRESYEHGEGRSLSIWSYEHGEGRSLSIWSYDQGVRRYQQEDSSTQATLRAEAHAHQGLVAEGVGRVLEMAPGFTFELSGHPIVGVDGSYLITRVEHLSRGIAEAIPELGTNESYYNTFECIPLETPFRAERETQKPTIEAVQTAVVTGPAGEEIHVDEHGRIKVQFHWDRQGQLDERTTCWIRVQQPWAGAGWGFWWVPRMGMEVVVHFVDGDPDRPLVTGAVYDGANPLPYPLPDEKTKSTIKSNSSIGGGGSNEFRFEDEAGSEQIYTHAEKDYNEVVEHDHTTYVKHDQTNSVDNDQTQTIGNDQTETVHGNQAMTVDGNRTVHVKADFDETVDGTETRHVQGDVTETFDSNEKREVASNLQETIGGDETRTIGGNQDETIGASHTLTIASDSTETVTGALDESVTGGITTTTPGSWDITATAGFSVTAAGGVSVLAPGGVKMIAPAGVTRVDNNLFWRGVKKPDVGFMRYKATALAIEVVAIAIGFTGMKLEDTGIVIANEPLNLTQKVLEVDNNGFTFTLGNFEVDSAQKAKA